MPWLHTYRNSDGLRIGGPSKTTRGSEVIQMQDYTYPSVFLAYLIFAVFSGGAIYFFVRSLKDGYLGKNSEAVKYQMLADEETDYVD
jgi:hypothetical protein